MNENGQWTKGEFFSLIMVAILAVSTGLLVANSLFGENNIEYLIDSRIEENENIYQECMEYSTKNVKERCIRDNFYHKWDGMENGFYKFDINSYEEFHEWNVYEQRKSGRESGEFLWGVSLIGSTIVFGLFYWILFLFLWKFVTKISSRIEIIR